MPTITWAQASEAAIFLRVSFGNMLGEHEPLSAWLREIPESLNCCTGKAGVRALVHGLQAFAEEGY